MVFIPPNTFYQTIATTQPFSELVSVNIVLNSGAGTGQIVQNTWMDVATIHFEIVDPQLSSGIEWRTITPNRTNVFDDQNVEISANNLSGLNFVLPIEDSNNNNIPSQFFISQNYPNPFNPETKIRVGIPDEKDIGEISIKVYDIMGQKVKTLYQGHLEPGMHTIKWDGSDASGKRVSGGTYFYYLKSNKFHQIKKMVFLK